jgi:ATP-dependent Lon protease
MSMDALDEKLLEAYPGKVVRKDLLHEVKKGTNVPSYVLEFLLARFCASDDEEEINAGKEAVLETLQKSYVRPDEANKARSMVQQKGRHKFIDKVQVTYVEKEKRHWGEMENFNSKRIAINERFYKDNERLLEGGVWAEVMIGHNDVEEDDYAFFIEDLRPIQLSRFDFEGFIEGRTNFTRDEWMDAILRTVGLEPIGMDLRLKFHFIMRLLPFVEQNYNFIELGPRGNGKSYTYSEFSPYCTLLSGSQPSASTLFYNNARRTVGVIGFWDVVGFDEVGTMKVKDQDTIQLMKDYMANGRFSRGTEVIANASMAFVGNIDDSISTIVESSEHNLFKPLPKAFDLAVLHRMYNYLPGWEVPQPGSHMLTSNFGFITDYLAEAMHYLWKNVNRASFVQQNCKFGSHVVGRDEKAAIKTISGFLKLLHPDGKVEPHELNQYVEYALEGRRRVKEQLYKAKPDDEFEQFEFSYFNEDGKEVVVHCPESKGKIVVPGKSPSNGDDEDAGNELPAATVFTRPTNEDEVSGNDDKTSSSSPSEVSRAVLRELDDAIEQVELNLRRVIAEAFDDDPEKIPHHINSNFEQRIKAAIRKNPSLDPSNFKNLSSKLIYSDMMELEEIITGKDCWSTFVGQFRSKESLKVKFVQLSDLRNAIRHSRPVDEISHMEGSAAIKWFEGVLKK